MAGKSKIIEGVAGALGDLVDEKLLSRRDVLKGTGATVALGALPTGARIASEIAQKSGVEEALPAVVKTAAKLELPARLSDLPSYRELIDDINMTQWRENVDMYDDDMAAELIKDQLDSHGLSFDDVNIDPDNITYRDLLDDDFIEKTDVIGERDAYQNFDPDDLLSDDVEDIINWLDGNIDSGDLNYTADVIIKDLTENYNLTKPEIKKYFSDSGVFDDLENNILDDILAPKILAGIEVPGDFITDPKSWELLDQADPAGGRFAPYLEHKTTKERFELYDDDVAKIKEHLKGGPPPSILKIAEEMSEGRLYKDLPDSFLTDPTSWRVKNAKLQGINYPYIEHKEMQDQFEIPNEYVDTIKEYVKGKLKN